MIRYVAGKGIPNGLYANVASIFERSRRSRGAWWIGLFIPCCHIAPRQVSPLPRLQRVWNDEHLPPA